jgi:hypothetical protein
MFQVYRSGTLNAKTERRKFEEKVNHHHGRHFVEMEKIGLQ